MRPLIVLSSILSIYYLIIKLESSRAHNQVTTYNVETILITKAWYHPLLSKNRKSSSKDKDASIPLAALALARTIEVDVSLTIFSCKSFFTG